MKLEHLTPDGWKPCGATTRKCKYEVRPVGAGSFRDEVPPPPAFIDEAVAEVKAGKPNAIKSFFNSLFGGGKKEAPSVESQPSNPAPVVKPVTSVEPVIPSVLGKVVAGDSGRFEVACEDIWDLDKPVYVHKFGDFIKDQATAEKLHKADPNKLYQLGDCGVLAGELWNRNEYVKEYYMMKTASDPMFGTHHFVQLKDGTYADSLGIWSEEAFLSYWKATDPSCHIAKFEEEPEPEFKNPNFTISNPTLFNTVNELISKHMNGEKL
jgi:hypothetical protein